MKPLRVNDWLYTMAIYRNELVSDLEWDAMPPEEQVQSSTISPYRCRLSEIREYCSASSDGYTTLTTTFSRITCVGSVSEYDNVLRNV